MFLINVSVTPSETADQYRQAHLDFLNRHFEQGTFLLFGRFEASAGGLIIAKAESEANLHALLAQDPYMIHGVAQCDIQAFHVGKISADILNV
ncbi:YciI family protein [Neisseria yangbaofengii]|uniref:YciI family protein n=1 Tax=Neisseria yangbaofengii TaxID=2709396 RepID=UPI0013EE37E8|nr:YciI family protein [Neisseria yangbaofengii]